MLGMVQAQRRDDGIPPDDDFTAGPTALATRGWTLYDPNSNLTNTTADLGSNSFDLDINQGGSGAGAFWFDAQDASLIYKEGVGSMRMVVEVSVQNTARTGNTPLAGPHFRICGIAAHDPASLAVSSNYNYEHIGFGSTALGTPECEYKDTINSVTGAVSGASMPGFGSTTVVNANIAQVDRIEGELLLQRDYISGVSDTWTMAFRESGTLPWTTIHVAARPFAEILPETLAWGMMCYASSSSHNISGTFSNIRFEPASPV